MYRLGLHFDSPYLRAAVLKKNKNKVEIYALKSCPELDPALLGPLFKKKRKSSTGLSGKNVLTRVVPTQLGKSRHWETALRFQAETTSLLPPDQVLHVPVLLGPKKENALIHTASKEAIEALLKKCSLLGVDPDRVTSLPVGIIRYIRWKLPSLLDAYLIDLGSEETTAIWMEQGELKKSFCLEQGIEGLLQAFWNDQKRILLEKEAEGAAKRFNVLRYPSHNFPKLHETLSHFRSNLTKAILSFSQEGGAKTVIFTGRIDPFFNLTPFLLEGFREAVSAESNRSLPEEEPKYAAAIGMALDSSLQLRQGPFFPEKIWQRRGVLATLGLVASFLLTTFLCWWGMQSLKERTSTLNTFLQKELASWNLPISPKKPEVLLRTWSQAVQAHKKEYPLIPRSPKAREFLSWIASDPFFQQLKEEGDPLELLELHYRLLEFPTAGSPNKEYKTQAELLFKVKDPLTAERFRSYLLQQKEWVDLREKPSWEEKNGRYKTTFFLKNRGARV